jgi:hypothetical protein
LRIKSNPFSITFTFSCEIKIIARVIELILTMNNGIDKTMSNAFDILKLINILHIVNKDIRSKIIPSTNKINP